MISFFACVRVCVFEHLHVCGSFNTEKIKRHLIFTLQRRSAIFNPLP